MLRYFQVDHIRNASKDIHVRKELLSTVDSRAYILVVGPLLAMPLHTEDSQCNSSPSFYLRNLVRQMIEWCVQKSPIDQPDTIEKFCQLPYRESLAHAGNELEEYLIEEQQLQHCLAEVLRSSSQLTQAHQELAHLPFRGYISTTYDTFVETTYKQAHQRELPKFYTPSIAAAIKACQDEKPFMLKLYGDIDDAASIVFGQRLYTGPASIGEQHALCELLSMSTTVFLGFEETDPDLRHLTSLLQANQPLNVLTFPQLHILAQKHHKPTNSYVWEDNSNNMNTNTFHSSSSNIGVLPETYIISNTSIGSRTQKPNSPIPSLHPRAMPAPTYTKSASPIEIYTVYAYTQNDRTFFLRIKERLDILRRQRKRISCIEDEVTRSSAWRRHDHLETANLILLLVNSTLLNSDFCYCDQLYYAIERNRADSSHCCVIPVLLRSLPQSLLKGTPFGQLDFLPSTDKAISEYRDKDQAYNIITNSIELRLNLMGYYI